MRNRKIGASRASTQEDALALGNRQSMFGTKPLLGGGQNPDPRFWDFPCAILLQIEAVLGRFAGTLRYATLAD
jgi:hypothetical protein